MKKGLLFLMLSALTLGAWAQSSPYTGVAPESIVSGNDYYLYNVESGLWLQNNDRTTNDWHTRGQLGTRGIDLQLNADGAGYKINAKFGRSSINHENLYLDANDNDVWVFESVTVGSVSNAVTISCSGTVLGAREYVRTYKAKNLFTEETESNYYLENQANEGTKNNTWQIVTKAERLDKMAVAKESSPMDASWLVKSPDFANNDSRYSSWKRTGSWARGGDVNGDWGRGSMIMESWNSGDNVQISQVINEVPNGKYELQLQGYYRDGMAGDNTDFNDRGCTNETCIEARHDARTEVIRAKYFANTTEADLRSIIDETHTSAKTGPDCWNFTRLERYYFPNDMQTAQRAMNIEKAYVNDPIQVIVTDGNLTIGVKKTGSAAYDWVILDNFKLTYLGPVVDLDPYLETLNNNIAAAEAFNGQTTDALQAALDAALTAARATTGSTDVDEISAASSALFNALNAAQTVDVTVLSATIALAQTEGIDVTAANTVVEEATTVDAVNTALENLRTARRLNAVDKQPDIFTGSAPEEGGQYYLYNIGAQRYLTGGVDYGTHAAVNFAAQVATFTQSGDGWRIHTNIRTGSDALNHNGFVDCGGDGDTWYLIEVSTGVYNISQTNSNTGANLLGYSGGRRGNWWQVDSDNQGADQAINQWKLVTKEERDALMANASPTNPVDATYYIHAAGFDHHLPDAQMAFPQTSWQTWFPDGKGGNNGIGGWEPDFNWESWNSGNIKFYQELTDLTPGKYRLTAQAYYRHGNFNEAVSEFNNPKTDGAILYATNGNEVTAQSYIVPITSEVDKVPGYGRNSSVGSFPDDRNETAAQFFEVGLYKNVVNDIIVAADGKLTIGVEKFENNKAGEWVVADNFRLTYLGLPEVTIGDANYTTFVAPYNIATMPANVEAYACQVNNNSVHLEPVSAIPAGEAVVLKNTGTYKFSPSASAVELGTTNDLQASDGTVTGASGNIYALASKTNGVGFYPVGSSVTVPAGKGYLQIASEVKPFYGFDEDDATGISLMEDGRSQMEDGAIYNVAGQRLSKTQKGINIVNGKKIAVK